VYQFYFSIKYFLILKVSRLYWFKFFLQKETIFRINLFLKKTKTRKKLIFFPGIGGVNFHPPR